MLERQNDTTRGITDMNKYNTKLGQLLFLINRSQFYALVKSTQSDKYCKGFSTWQQLMTMCYAQIANHNGLKKSHQIS